jgi:hypothetical protein
MVPRVAGARYGFPFMPEKGQAPGIALPTLLKPKQRGSLKTRID